MDLCVSGLFVATVKAVNQTLPIHQPWDSNSHCFNGLCQTTLVLPTILHYKTRSTILLIVLEG